MGRLKWPYRDTIEADINAIIIGYEGYLDDLRDIYGPPDKGEKRNAKVTATPAMFDAIFR